MRFNERNADGSLRFERNVKSLWPTRWANGSTVVPRTLVLSSGDDDSIDIQLLDTHGQPIMEHNVQSFVEVGFIQAIIERAYPSAYVEIETGGAAA